MVSNKVKLKDELESKTVVQLKKLVKDNDLPISSIGKSGKGGLPKKDDYIVALVDFLSKYSTKRSVTIKSSPVKKSKKQTVKTTKKSAEKRVKGSSKAESSVKKSKKQTVKTTKKSTEKRVKSSFKDEEAPAKKGKKVENKGGLTLKKERTVKKKSPLQKSILIDKDHVKSKKTVRFKSLSPKKDLDDEEYNKCASPNMTEDNIGKYHKCEVHEVCNFDTQVCIPKTAKYMVRKTILDTTFNKIGDRLVVVGKLENILALQKKIGGKVKKSSFTLEDTIVDRRDELHPLSVSINERVRKMFNNIKTLEVDQTLFLERLDKSMQHITDLGRRVYKKTGTIIREVANQESDFEKYIIDLSLSKNIPRTNENTKKEIEENLESSSESEEVQTFKKALKKIPVEKKRRRI